MSCAVMMNVDSCVVQLGKAGLLYSMNIISFFSGIW